MHLALGIMRIMRIQALQEVSKSGWISSTLDKLFNEHLEAVWKQYCPYIASKI